MWCSNLFDNSVLVPSGRGWFVCSAIAMTALLSGCAQRVTQTEQYARTADPADRPIIISTTPDRDRIAYEDAQSELSDADWAVLEQLGPRPIWDRLGRRDRRYQVEEDDRRRRHEPRQREDTSHPQGRGIPDEGGGDADVEGAQAPTTQPVDRTVVTTQPSRPAEDISEQDLPVTVVELPDGQIRMIWHLRSYGGTMVSAERDGGTTRREVSTEPADLEPLVAIVEHQVGDDGSVMALPNENTLVITCNGELRDSVLDLLARLDIPPRQVEITAKIFEVSHDFDFQQGARFLVNRIADNDAQDLISTFDTRRFLDSLDDGPYQGSVVHLMRTFEDAGVSMEASFQLLAESGLIRVVSSPRMTVAAGQTGYLLAGQELPIQSSTIAGSSQRITTEYKPVGVQLYITPQAVSDDQIKLHTITVVSSLAGFAPIPDITGAVHAAPALINPIIDSREAETSVTIDDRHTLVISGLRIIRTVTRENKVPLLGDLPVLGWLFKNHRSQQQMTDLYFFVTPTLL
jgi:type II secretory pathway component GspD/PulD (secretin)